MRKNRNPLSHVERFKNLTNALSVDALADKTPLTKDELAEDERVKRKFLEAAGQEVSGVWEKRTAKENEPSDHKKNR